MWTFAEYEIAGWLSLHFSYLGIVQTIKVEALEDLVVPWRLIWIRDGSYGKLTIYKRRNGSRHEPSYLIPL